MGNKTSKGGGDGGNNNGGGGGGGPAPRRAQPNGRVVNAITKNKKTAVMLEKKIALLDKRKDKQVLEAKKWLKAGNKKKAMLCLKRKKMLEKQIDQYTNTIFTLEQQGFVLEGAQTNANVVDAMKVTKDTMAHINKNTDVDDVTELMDELQEQTENASELSEVLGQGMGEMADEDELLAELDELNQEDADQIVDNMPVVLPKVPTNKIKEKKQEEEDALNELEAMME